VRRRCTLAVLVAVAALLSPAAATASPRQFTIFEAPRELLAGDAALRERTLDEIRGLGATHVRLIMYWQHVAPAADAKHRPRFAERDPAAYAWGAYDAAVDAARARGLQVLLTVSGPVPRWATAGHRNHRTRPSPTRFRRFMTAVGRHFGGRVALWSIWNEPNHPKFLLPQFRHHHAVSGRIYRRLFLAGWRGLRESGHGRDPVLAGETAPRGTGKVVAPITFLRQALCLSRSYRKRRSCSNLPADGWAHHPYTTRAGPWFRPPSRGDVTIGVLSRLNRALGRAARAGAVRYSLPIYVTEFGIQSWPDHLLGVSPTRQAEFRSIAERMAYRNRRVASFAQYLMRDSKVRPFAGAARFSGYESGLRGRRGARKRAYAAFRLPLVALRGRHRTRLWGLVRPATGPTTVTLEFRGRHGRRWHRLKRDHTNARGVWSTTTRTRAGRRYRVRWSRYAGPPTRSYRHP
jgi:hypothetical protein